MSDTALYPELTTTEPAPPCDCLNCRAERILGGDCPCVEFFLNKVMYADPQCAHTRGERPPETAKVFDSRANALAARAFVREAVTK